MAQRVLLRHLMNVPVSVEDNSLNSSEYFGFDELPDFFRLGTNKIVSDPQENNLQINSPIEMEAIDSNGFGLLFTVDRETNSSNKVVLNLVVDRETPIEFLTLIFVGTLKSGSKVRWTRKFTVDREGVKLFGSPSGSLITGSFFIGDKPGNGLELFGRNNAFIKSANYRGLNLATASLGPAGFMLFSGSVLKGTGDEYSGIGFEIATSGSRFLKMRSSAIPGPTPSSPIEPSFDIGADNISADNITATTASVKYLMIDKNTIPQADPVVAGAIFVDPATGTLKISGFS